MAWLEDTLKTVKFEGFAEANKHQILDAVGYRNDTEGAWEELARKYKSIAGTSSALFIRKISDRVILSSGNFQKIT